MEIKVGNESIKEIIDGHIKAAVLEAISKHSTYVIDKLVEEALRKPDTNSYGRQTVIESALNKAILDEANGAVKEWIDSQRAAIRDMVRRKLDSKNKGLIAQIADQLVGKLGSELKVSARFIASE